jgi:hypothetical protein
MPSSAAAIWSAVAASFAALSSLLIMLIQRRNLLETTQPVFVLAGWSRRTEGQGAGAHEVIRVKSIRNVGKGLGLHLYFRVLEMAAVAPTAVMPTIVLPLLVPNEELEIGAEIVVWWKNVTTQSTGGKVLPINFSVTCFDSRGTRHMTLYRLILLERADPVAGATMVAPGLAVLSRTNTTTAGWWIRCAGRLVKVPWVGRAFRSTLRP